MRSARHREPPRSDRTRHPSRLLLHPLRPAARALVRRRLAVRLHGEGHVPARGPVILACNHTGWADGPLLALLAPRPVHVLTKSEMFHGALGLFLRVSGQVRLDRFHPDPRAVKACLRVLRDGGVVGVFPEGTRGHGEFTTLRCGAAYLALVTGAPVVPVLMFGVRKPGEPSSAVPGRGDRVDVVFGTPWRTPARPWPRTRVCVAAATRDLQAHLRTELVTAQRVTGGALPGPLPAGDPATEIPFGPEPVEENHD